MTASMTRIAALATATCIALCGCAVRAGPPGPPIFAPVQGAGPGQLDMPPVPTRHPTVIQAAHRVAEFDAGLQPGHTPLHATHPFDGITTLRAEDVVRVVLERNPTLDQMRAAAAAVAARYPQVTSLDDPNLAFSTAPGSIGSPHANYAARDWRQFLFPLATVTSPL